MRISLRMMLGALCVLNVPPPDHAIAGEDWSGYVRAFISYDDNVALVTSDQPSGAQEASLGIGLSAAAGVSLLRDGPTTVNIGITASGVRQTGNADFDVIVAAPSISVRHHVDGLGIPTTLNGSVNVGRTYVGSDGFSTAVTVQAGADLRPWPGLTITPSGSLNYTAFDDDGANPAATSRDAVGVTAGLTASYVVTDTFTTLSGGISHSRNLARGDNFDFHSTGLTAGVSQPFDTSIGPVTATAKLSVARKVHTNFTTTPQRQQIVTAANAGLAWQVAPDLTVDVSAGYQSSTANRPDFDYDRLRFTAGLTYRF